MTRSFFENLGGTSFTVYASEVVLDEFSQATEEKQRRPPQPATRVVKSFGPSGGFPRARDEHDLPRLLTGNSNLGKLEPSSSSPWRLHGSPPNLRTPQESSTCGWRGQSHDGAVQ